MQGAKAAESRAHSKVAGSSAWKVKPALVAVPLGVEVTIVVCGAVPSGSGPIVQM